MNLHFCERIRLNLNEFGDTINVTKAKKKGGGVEMCGTPTVVFRLFIATRLASIHYGKSYNFPGKLRRISLTTPFLDDKIDEPH